MSSTGRYFAMLIKFLFLEVKKNKVRENRSWEFNWRKTQLSPAGAEAELGNISREKLVNIVCIFFLRG